jgi:hypothetical protein
MARSRISGEQIIDEDVLSEEEHDAWVHKNLVCSGTVTIDAPVMISGSGDVYCKDLHTADNSIYLGTTKLSADVGGNILIDDAPLTAEAETTGYTGAVPIVSSISVTGEVTNNYLVFENGVLTTVSGGTPTQIPVPDSLLSIM